MLYVAPSILLAAAIAAAQPVPTQAAPDGEQKRAAAAWVQDGVAWTNQLTAYGENLGKMLPPILDGKPGNEMQIELKRTKAAVDAKLASFRARPSPVFAEMSAFRAVFRDDYLAWENRTVVTLMGDLLKIAENQKLARAKREKALLETLRSTENDENAWKAKLEASRQAVQAAVNRK